ncbi:alpha-1,3-mannosyltransferase MNT3 NDAI_0H01270 [Naumovozyma dairenensis CBS 421]|uniref:Alpha-1,3-mannosyltransferase n=1 Tax=Naumovozyma dairenensis (strain ATCC 10597 / BCRC 20456 / CBS 421 / NBRC 0211 / NRRL Y-12639) TaxID=1071378 RepID=G0WEU0_NAUDC|nr:hypothetical protein NDAI_0H01270 [Naumovozyma dairenensis CBS 421]CCD26301.1 hypothetical protein NDAI_0H01270 [Naumovozyma dairenensis CBS 421]
MTYVFRIRRAISKSKLIISITILILLCLIFSTSDKLTSPPSTPSSTTTNDISDPDAGIDKTYRDAHPLSVFATIHKRRHNLIKGQSLLDKFLLSKMKFNSFEEQTLLHWFNKDTQSTRINQCKYLIATQYNVEPNWNNDKSCKFYSIEEIDDMFVSTLAERLRIFDYCFISGKLKMSQVFTGDLPLKDTSIKVDSFDYQKRLFPYLYNNLTDYLNQDIMWPTIIDLSSSESPSPIDQASTIDDFLKEEGIDKHTFNSEFWYYYTQKMSMGKGIVVTMSEGDSYMFKKQLKVLDHLNNELPIQIITKGNEFSTEFINDLSNFVQKETKQKVAILNISSMLDPAFADKYIVNFYNKWLAVIFNTFQEIIILDADVVPFVPINDFFEEKKFKNSGMLLYKDRLMVNEHTFSYCIDSMKFLEPSSLELKYLNTKLLVDSNTEIAIPPSSEELSVYYNFFKNLRLHHIDSGLVVINKQEKLNGLLLSFALHLDGKLRRCVYGDKEFFWLGQLFIGQDYSIYSMDGGVSGPLGETNPDGKNSVANEHYICSAQISHVDTLGNLLWQNGGSNFCKIPNAADTDFQRNPDYFKERYREVSNLRNLYASPVRFDGVIIPDGSSNPWVQLEECSHFMYCGYYSDDNHQDMKLDSGFMKKFSKEKLP